MSKKRKPTIIKNPPKSWWAGDERVDKYMLPVADAIIKYHKWPSPEFTDIYNRAYEAVYLAIKDMKEKSKEKLYTRDEVNAILAEAWLAQTKED